MTGELLVHTVDGWNPNSLFFHELLSLWLLSNTSSITWHDSYFPSTPKEHILVGGPTQESLGSENNHIKTLRILRGSKCHFNIWINCLNYNFFKNALGEQIKYTINFKVKYSILVSVAYNIYHTILLQTLELQEENVQCLRHYIKHTSRPRNFTCRMSPKIDVFNNFL